MVGLNSVRAPAPESRLRDEIRRIAGVGIEPEETRVRSRTGGSSDRAADRPGSAGPVDVRSQLQSKSDPGHRAAAAVNRENNIVGRAVRCEGAAGAV